MKNNNWKTAPQQNNEPQALTVLRRRTTSPQAWPESSRTTPHTRTGNAWPPGYEKQASGITVRLPTIPRSASPVPWLTSLHATDGRGEYGSAAYRGNCSGLFIRDLLNFYRPRHVLDPMSGSGTCRDVCQELNIECLSFDIHNGLDAVETANYAALSQFDFVWMHPPYWKLIKYGEDPRCLSNSPTLADFVAKMQTVFWNCRQILTNNGKIAVLMGDGREHGEYWALPHRVLQAAENVGLRLAAPEIIRFGHGATSSSREYSGAFIPLLHDVCWVFKAAQSVKGER